MITKKEYQEIIENLEYSLKIKLITLKQYNELFKETFNRNHENGIFTGNNDGIQNNEEQ